jgi:hypothetical protein
VIALALRVLLAAVVTFFVTMVLSLAADQGRNRTLSPVCDVGLLLGPPSAFIALLLPARALGQARTLSALPGVAVGFWFLMFPVLDLSSPGSGEKASFGLWLPGIPIVWASLWLLRRGVRRTSTSSRGGG